MSELPEFKGFQKIARLSREAIVTEKIDGTNAQVFITDSGEVFAGSKSRWITPENDNFGFARWVAEHKDELLKLGPGAHFGEWWGKGIQRGYGLAEKRFSLFNTSRWTDDVRPTCCHIVPVLYRGIFGSFSTDELINELREHGSFGAPGFTKPEGIVIFHVAANFLFKKTIEKDEVPKGVVANE